MELRIFFDGDGYTLAKEKCAKVQGKMPEERTDVYFDLGEDVFGLKKRGGDSLEVKVRQKRVKGSGVEYWKKTTGLKESESLWKELVDLAGNSQGFDAKHFLERAKEWKLADKGYVVEKQRISYALNTKDIAAELVSDPSAAVELLAVGDSIMVEEAAFNVFKKGADGESTPLLSNVRSFCIEMGSETAAAGVMHHFLIPQIKSHQPSYMYLGGYPGFLCYLSSKLTIRRSSILSSSPPPSLPLSSSPLSSFTSSPVNNEASSSSSSSSSSPSSVNSKASSSSSSKTETSKSLLLLNHCSRCSKCRAVSEWAKGLQVPVTELSLESLQKGGGGDLSALNPLLLLLHWPLCKKPLAPVLRATADLRARFPQTFICVLSPPIQEHAKSRQTAIEAGANMVTSGLLAHQADIDTMAKQVLEESWGDGKGAYTCPYCKLGGMSEDELWLHCPLWHINVPNQESYGFLCPVCGKSREELREEFQPHLRNAHGPAARGDVHVEDNTTRQNLWAFSLVVVQRPSDNKFLLVQEYGDSGYWLPGGRVDPGELLGPAGIREALEEGGVKVDLKGILRWEFSPRKVSARLRVIFYATPSIDSPPEKTLPDYESVGACWVSAAEIAAGNPNLRGPEPRQWFSYVASGGPIYPLCLLALEGQPAASPSIPFFAVTSEQNSNGSSSSSSSSSSPFSSSSGPCNQQ